MSDIVNSTILGFVVFVLFLSVFWYLDDVTKKKEISVDWITSRWGSVDPQVTEVRTAISFQNPHKTNVQLTQVDYEVFLGDTRIENGTRFQTLRLAAGSNATVQFTARLPASFLSTWWTTYIDEGESIKFAIQGHAHFAEGPKETVVPFSIEANWHESLLSAVADGLDNCPSEPVSVCISSAHPDWVVTSTGQRGLVLSVEFHNPNASSLRLRGLAGTLFLADVPLADGTVRQDVLLGPHGDERVDLVLVTDTSQLQAWWPRHVQACETSPTRTHLAFELHEKTEGNDTEAATDNVSLIDWSLPGQPFQTRFLCNHS